MNHQYMRVEVIEPNSGLLYLRLDEIVAIRELKPESGQELYAIITRHGQYVAKGKFEDVTDMLSATFGMPMDVVQEAEDA